MNVRILDKIKSTINRNTVRIAVNESTTKVDPFNSSQFGQDTLFISNCTSEVNCWIFLNIIYLFYQNYCFIKKLKPSQIYQSTWHPSTVPFAGEAGLEPATPGFGDRCSTN
tara:strand:- start:266 stop:598 length:333 start_codon:yes stop_codon:yes gene_type:complete